MPKREVICSKQIHCLSCPLSVRVTGKDCRQLLIKEIEDLSDEEFKEFLNKQINLRNELQENFNRKYGDIDETKKA